MKKEEPCTHRKQAITTADLPLCCPMPDQRLWDGHPRVYLPIEETGFAKCPYCETRYTLV